ncbi:MAG: malate:quinone oxidoreductase, partial [Mycobacterium sp.]|nr:malate:quinone oxidoreductase [Mycobacterium sp.]
AVPAMLGVLQRCFPDRYQRWLPTLKDMVPSLGAALSRDPELFEEVWSWGSKALGLQQSDCRPPPPAQPPASSAGADTAGG